MHHYPPQPCVGCRKAYPSCEHAAYGTRCEDCFAEQQHDRRMPGFWVFWTASTWGQETGGGRRVLRRESV